MNPSMVIGGLAIAAIPVAFLAHSLSEKQQTAAADIEVSRQVQERFAIQFCYRQYRDQGDVLRCLAQAL